ncbi:hypothetical protein NKR23_g1597 [Pleurostoma richardsiae]|uniref:Mitochondrial division protein 1 n=1 Tax=Pleurostoma richardsiae TaxID=41990 RepID=A0AA38RRC2_9PEZI|nr:hypothetical protein NKR23_g1597 [Pleurostoma richardsiae]
METISTSVRNIDAAGSARVHVGNNIYYSEGRCLTALRVTDPRHDKIRIERDKGGLLDDVSQWVLNNKEFLRWRHGRRNRLLWVKGDPGKGKTMLLCGIVNELEKDKDNGILSYFFCQATDARINSATAVLRGLIYMLVDTQPSLISHVRKRYDRAGVGLFEGVNAWVAVRDIFMDVIGDLAQKNLLLVVDALDECQMDRSELLDLIVSTTARIKWLVSSRNWPDINEALAKTGRKIPLSLELNAKSVSAAVQLFIQEKVRMLASRKRYDVETTLQVANYLSLHASDTFLWVALVCRSLAKVPAFEAVMTLHTFPGGLDALYSRMMLKICDMNNTDRVGLCMQILAIVSTVYRPVTLEELYPLLDCPRGISNDHGFLEYYVGLCGSFLAIRDGTVSFVHQSAKDFLCSPELNRKFIEVFPHAIRGTHHKIFQKSLQQLSRILHRDMYHLSHPGVAVEDVTPPWPDPLSATRYASVYWVDHLCDACASNQVMGVEDLEYKGIVHNFLVEKFLYWLEALSLTREMRKGVLAVERLRIYLQTRVQGSQLDRLVRDMLRFMLSHRCAIEIAPLQAYISALVFSPARSLTRRYFRSEEPKWVKTSIMEEDWSACLTTFEGHISGVSSVAFSPDGCQLASSSSDCTVKLWDATTGNCVTTFKGHSMSVSSVAFSPDGRHLVSASYDRTVKLWDITTGTCVITFEGHGGMVYSVSFSPDGYQLASASHDRTVKLWDITTGTCVITFEGHGDIVYSVAFSPDARQLASASYDCTVKLWDITTGVCILTFEGHSGIINSVTFSPDGRQLASASYDCTIKLWDITEMRGTCISTFKGHGGIVTSIAFSPAGHQLASASWDSTVKLWDTTRMKDTCISTFEGHGGIVNSVAFSPDGCQLASASWDYTVKLWDTTKMTDTCVSTFEGHSGIVNSVTFSPDGRQLASASYDCTVKLWDTTKMRGTCTATFEGCGGIVNSVVFSPDGCQLAAASWDYTVKLWDTATTDGVCSQKIYSDRDLQTAVSFNLMRTCLRADKGPLDFRPPCSPLSDTIVNSELQDVRAQTYGISDDGEWITYDAKNLLWLPSTYRPFKKGSGICLPVYNQL